MQHNSVIKNTGTATKSETKWWWFLFTTDLTIAYYSIVVALSIVVTIIAPLTFYYWCIKAGTTMHHKMFNNIIHSPMRFFNTNASGRILNRFARDIGILDESIPVTILDTIQVSLCYLFSKKSDIFGKQNFCWRGHIKYSRTTTILIKQLKQNTSLVLYYSTISFHINFCSCKNMN